MVLTKIYEFARTTHAHQSYDGQPYTVHLDAVERVLADAGMATATDRIIARSHDTIEDSVDPEAANSFLKQNITAFEHSVVWALTGVGANRKARNADAKAKIKAFPQAANYKVADRIANWENSQPGTRLDAMYAKEHAEFAADVVSLATNVYLRDRYFARAARST